MFGVCLGGSGFVISFWLISLTFFHFCDDLLGSFGSLGFRGFFGTEFFLGFSFFICDTSLLND